MSRNVQRAREARDSHTRRVLKACAIERSVAAAIPENVRQRRLEAIASAIAKCDRGASPDELIEAAHVLATPPADPQGRLI